MGNTLDDDNRQVVAPLHYAPITNLANPSPSAPSTDARQRAGPEQGHIVPYTTRTCIAAETVRQGDRARCMPPEVAELLTPFDEGSSALSMRTVIDTGPKGDLAAARNVSHALPLEAPWLRDRGAVGTGLSTRKRAYHSGGVCDRVPMLPDADLPEYHCAVLSRPFRIPGVDRDVPVPRARVLAGSRRRLAKALLWLCYLADAACLRCLGVWR